MTNTMTTELMIKEVDFNGANLLAAQDNNGKIFVGVSYICNGIGFNKNQKDTQVKNVQNDIVLNKGCKHLSVKFDEQVREVLSLELDYLPLWLAKISITPTMLSKYPEVVDKLIEYQFKAKDILAKAFLPNENSIIQNYLQLDDEERAIIYFQERKERKLLELQAQELIPKANSFDKLIGANGSQSMNAVAKSFKVGRTRLFAFLRDKDILMVGSKTDKEKHNVPYQQYLERKLFVVREYTIPDDDGELVNRTQTLVTAKGIEFIDKLLKEVNYNLDIYPDLETWQ